MIRDRQAGVALFNVLSVTALLSLIVLTMISLGDVAISRSQRYSEAGQALSLVTAGEASAMSALVADRSDGVETDHPDEGWGRIEQQSIAIEGGDFMLSIRDAQDRINLANFRPERPLGLVRGNRRSVLAAVVAMGLDPALSEPLIEAAARTDVAPTWDALAQAAGLSPETAETLSQVFTFLPEPTPVNLNTASVPVLAAVLGDPARAGAIASRRDRGGALQQADLTALNILPSSDHGLRSAYFEVTVRVTIGATTQVFESLISRPLPTGRIQVVSRRRLAAP